MSTSLTIQKSLREKSFWTNACRRGFQKDFEANYYYSFGRNRRLDLKRRNSRNQHSRRIGQSVYGSRSRDAPVLSSTKSQPAPRPILLQPFSRSRSISPVSQWLSHSCQRSECTLPMLSIGSLWSEQETVRLGFRIATFSNL